MCHNILLNLILYIPTSLDLCCLSIHRHDFVLDIYVCVEQYCMAVDPGVPFVHDAL